MNWQGDVLAVILWIEIGLLQTVYVFRGLSALIEAISSINYTTAFALLYVKAFADTINQIW